MKNLFSNAIPQSIKRDFLIISVLLIICCIAYWPLTFHVFSLKNDALNYFLPVRFQVSEAIYNHEYPFWSPYFNLGYPLHGDMQSGVWNPVVQFFSLFGPYSLYKLQLETLFYIFLSGAGMYFLLKHTGLNIYATLFASVAYMLCGFNSDCCQYLNWISGAAFLPFIILFYYKMLKEKNISTSLLAGFFLYCMFVSAYPAHFIVTLYLLLSIFIYHIVVERKKKGVPAARIFVSGLTRHFPAILSFILLSLPAILSYAQFLPNSERGGGAGYEDAMSNPLHPLLFMAWLTPLPIHQIPFVEITDPLERNSYFGIITFVFTLSAYFIKTDDPRVKFSKIAAIVFLVMSLGKFGGLRVLSYYLLPLMNSFRHPAGLKIFTIFFSCILAAWCLNVYITEDSARVKIKKTSFFCMAILAILLLFSLPGISGTSQKVLALLKILQLRDLVAIAPAFKQLFSSITFKEALFTDTIIQLFFLSLLLVYAGNKINFKTVVLLNILNCTFYVFLFTPSTVVKKDTADNIQKILNENIISGYPLPSLASTLEENSMEGKKRFDEIGCLNMYNKKVGRVDYRISPCNLLSQNEFWFRPAIRNTIMRYPLLNKPDTVFSIKDSSLAINSNSKNSIAFVDNPVISEAINKYQSGGKSKIAINSFRPNHFCFTSRSDSKAFYVLLQNYYPMWKLKVDGIENPIIHSDISFMGFEVPEGDHKIEFIYSDDKLVAALWLNILLTIGMLVILITEYFRRPVSNPS